MHDAADDDAAAADAAITHSGMGKKWSWLPNVLGLMMLMLMMLMLRLTLRLMMLLMLPLPLMLQLLLCLMMMLWLLLMMLMQLLPADNLVRAVHIVVPAAFRDGWT